MKICLLLGFLGAASLTACGGASSSADGDTASFVGTWTCTGTVTQTFTSPTASSTSSPATEELVFAASPNGTLTATAPVDAGGDGCPLQYSVSGSTATLEASLQPCAYNAMGTLTYTGGNFAVSGATATSTLTSTVNGTGIAPDGGSDHVTESTVFDATCTKG